MKSPLKAAPHLVLLIGDEGASLAVHAPSASGPSSSRALFAAAKDSEAEKNILALIARHGKASRLTLLIDTLAQDYRVETVPRVNPFDRAKLIRNRLRQSFPGAAAAAFLKLDATRVGLASWHADGNSRRWIDKLAPCAPRVALLPIEGAKLAATLAPRDGWTLLLSLQRGGGLRQIVTNKGVPLFTRLTPAPPALDPETVATAAAQDIKTTLGYLSRLGLDDSRNLRVVALLPDSARPVFAQADLNLRDLALLAPSEAARRLGLPAPRDDDPFGDILFAAAAARRKTPRLDATPAAWRQARNDNALRDFGKRLSVAALLLAALGTGGQAIAFAQALLAARQETARRDTAQTKLNDERAKAAPVTEPLGRLRAAVERQRLFELPAPAPWPMLDALRQTLPPATRLAALEWSAPPTTTQNAAQGMPQNAAQSAAQNATQSVPQNAPPTPNAPAPLRQAETLRLTLRLQSPAQNNAPADREQWRESLREATRVIAQALPEFSLAITRSPFPTRPEESLTGGDSAALNGEPTADILLTRRSAAP